MQTALPVLTAISERREPDANDIAALNAVDGLPSNLTPFELACDVLQQALGSFFQLRITQPGV